MRRIEQTVRDAEDKKWSQSNPELSARAASMVAQLESRVTDLRDDLATAEAKGDTSRAAKIQEQIDAQQAWLDQARKGLDEFGG